MSIRSSSEAVRELAPTPGDVLWTTPRSEVVAYAGGLAVVPQPPFDASGLQAELRRIPTEEAGRPDTVVEDPFAPRLVYKWVGCVPIKKLIAVNELGAAEAAVLGMEVCEHLEVLAGVGMCHGALSSHNVVLDAYQRVRLLETGFGPRSRPDKDGLSYCSYDSTRRATPTAADDIFALGAILFECCAGHPPFEGARASTTRAALLDDAVPFSSFPEPFVTLVDEMLDPDPRRRPTLAIVSHVLDGVIRQARNDKSGRPLAERESGVRFSAGEVAAPELSSAPRLALPPAAPGIESSPRSSSKSSETEASSRTGAIAVALLAVAVIAAIIAYALF